MPRDLTIIEKNQITAAAAAVSREEEGQKKEQYKEREKIRLQ